MWPRHSKSLFLPTRRCKQLTTTNPTPGSTTTTSNLPTRFHLDCYAIKSTYSTNHKQNTFLMDNYIQPNSFAQQLPLLTLLLILPLVIDPPSTTPTQLTYTTSKVFTTPTLSKAIHTTSSTAILTTSPHRPTSSLHILFTPSPPPTGCTFTNSTTYAIVYTVVPTAHQR